MSERMLSLFVWSARRSGKVAIFLLRFFEGLNGMTGCVAVYGPADRLGSSVGVEVSLLW